MRPEILYPLFADITTINGLGEKGAKLVERLLGSRRILDLVFHLKKFYMVYYYLNEQK